MLRDISRNFFEGINPIKEAIMLSIIAFISVVIAYFSYDFLKGKLPLPFLLPLIGLLAIVVFLLILLIVVAIQRIVQGADVEFPEKIGKGKFDAMYREDEDIVEIPIFLPVKNRDKYKEIVCYSVLEKFEIIYDEKRHFSSNITKTLKANNLIRSKVPYLRWQERDYENQDCEIRIPPQQERKIEIAHFQFLLKKSFEENHARGSIGLQYCKSAERQKTQLGLYDVRIAIKYKKNSDEWRTMYFDGYLYANVIEHSLAWKLGEDDIRNRMEGEVVIGSGSWKKNKDLPKPVLRGNATT